ncbi:MAG: hypothetical protein ABFQ95_07560 [Pseudomonadota bacterium]
MLKNRALIVTMTLLLFSIGATATDVSGLGKEETWEVIKKKCEKARTTADITGLYEDVGVGNVKPLRIIGRVGVPNLLDLELLTYVRDLESVKGQFDDSANWKLDDFSSMLAKENEYWKFSCYYDNPQQLVKGNPYNLNTYTGDRLSITFKWTGQ